MQIICYRSFPLLVCSPFLIECSYCSCAKRALLSSSCVQEVYYRMLVLLMCIILIIELFFLLGCVYVIIECSPCFCARNFLLIVTFAYVQARHYWSIFLLVCNRVIIKLDLNNKGIVERISCSRAKSFLLISPIVYVQIFSYWRCNLLMCRPDLIDLNFCWCAINPLLKFMGCSRAIKVLLNGCFAFCAGIVLLIIQ